MFTLDEMVSATGGKILNGEKGEVFSGIATDSRTIKQGEIFIALHGPNFDGHDFLDEVVSKGAKGVIVEREIAFTVHSSQFTVILVPDTLRAFQDIAHYVRMKYRIPVIGVTGSNGKSTTKEMIASILMKKWNILKSEGNINNHIGVPLTLLKLMPEHEAVVLEMAMRAEGEITRLSEIARPTVGVITNIGPAHLETLGGLDRVARAKAEILDVLDCEEGVAVLNNDDLYLSRLDISWYKGWVITFGFGQDADLMAEGVKFKGPYSNFSISVKTNILDYLLPSVVFPHSALVTGKKKEIKIKRINLPLPGRHNIYNALAATSVALALGFDIPTIREGLEKFSPLPMRSEVIEIRGRKIINDTYNSNPESMDAALQSLIQLKNKGKAIAVLGDMLELGEYKEKAHRELGSKIAKMHIDEFVAVGDLMKYAAEAAEKEGMETGRIHICNNPEEARETIKKVSKEKDTILLKGSRAVGMENALEGDF